MSRTKRFDKATNVDFQLVLKRAENEFRTLGLQSAVKFLKKYSGHISHAELMSRLAKSMHSKDPNSALKIASAALAIDESCISAWQLTGSIKDRLGDRKSASAAFMRVIQSAISTPPQILHSANMLVRMGDQRLAVQAGYKAFNDMGRPLHAISPLMYIAQKTANWALMEELKAQLKEAYSSGFFDQVRESPRTHLNWCGSEEWNIGVVKESNKRTLPHVSHTIPKPEPTNGRKLRVAYLSSDFREHPTSRLVLGLFRNHDRSKIELFMLCSGWDDGSAIRKEVESYFDHVYTVTHMSDKDAASLIKSLKIDVLVELNGPTRANRMGILCHRPAPVQIDYLGWPGSIGGRVVDAVVGDAYVVKPEYEHLYPEKIIKLEKTYQINNYKYLPKMIIPSRQELNLPDNGELILGVFNGIEKIHAEVWFVWMKIMAEVSNAVLWMLDPGPVARKNIEQVTQKYGVDQKRILIAPRVPQNKHLARMGACDLMLDTWPYGGHTTTSDALFAGVPVVALEGTNFASRVSGSLLHSAGLGALVASDIKKYASLAVHLLRNKAELEKVKSFVENKSINSDVFNASNKARQLEHVYAEMVNSRLSKNN